MKPIMDYYKLVRASNLLECEVDDIIHFWLTGRIKLQVNLNAEPCSLSRYLPDDRLERSFYRMLGDIYGSDNIYTGRRWFLDNGVESEDSFLDEESNVGLFTYTGKAYGLWDIVPTIVTRFIDEGVVLSDMFGVLDMDNKSGVAFVHGFSSYRRNDFLCFEKPVNVEKTNLIIDHDNLQKIVNFFKIGIWDGKDEEENKSDSYSVGIVDIKKRQRTSSSARNAIKIMLQELYPESIGNYKKISELLEATATSQGKSISFDDYTIGRWLKE
ncbi:hypothetical protein KP22_15920 [Pectobacterium betavasculorum]|uniref:Uncharacterized protein n=1 Tax=Pectobacterium betavasculorum TaxID=55207 RepID=A0A093S0E7_9GAMM|nr:hypothetical protein [Pectobacterium betavasculorum]KFX03561.1 hypothetical protein KP22_15920 [Pectobacterium betavasculorum]